MQKRTSTEIIASIDKQTIKRLRKSNVFLSCISVLLLVFLVWVKLDTNNLIKGIKDQNDVATQRTVARNAQIDSVIAGLKNVGDDNNRLSKENKQLLLCLLAIHDPEHFGNLTSNVDCQAQVEAINSSLPAQTPSVGNSSTLGSQPAAKDTSGKQSTPPPAPKPTPLILPPGQGLIRDSVPVLGLL